MCISNRRRISSKHRTKSSNLVAVTANLGHRLIFLNRSSSPSRTLLFHFIFGLVGLALRILQL
jgi:hypothetical protein